MKLLLSMIGLLVLSACNVTTTYLVSSKGITIQAYYRDEPQMRRTFFGNRGVDGILAAFRLATPLDRIGPEDSPSDVIFDYCIDGVSKDKYVLHRNGELFHAGSWYAIDKEWLYRWQSEYDPRNSRPPNQPLQRNDHGCHANGTKIRPFLRQF